MSGQRQRVLLNKPPRGRLGLSRWGLLFALPFLAVGAWMAGIGVGVYPPQPGTTALPPWLVAAIGIIFFVVGLYIVAETLRGMAGRARRAGTRPGAVALRPPLVAPSRPRRHRLVRLP